MPGWQNRPSSNTYSSPAWRAIRRRVLVEEPTCRLQLPGCTQRSTTVDHIESAAQRPDLFYERSNLRGACWSCNNVRASQAGATSSRRDNKVNRRRPPEPHPGRVNA